MSSGNLTGAGASVALQNLAKVDRLATDYIVTCSVATWQELSKIPRL